MDRDRNLLFGVLAVQLKKLTPAQLVEVAAAWATDPSKDLPQRLMEGGVLSEQDCKLLGDFVADAVKAYGGDASKSLNAFGGEAQVHQSFRGSIVLSESGGVQSVAMMKPAEDFVEADNLPGVQETPGRYTLKGEYGRGGMGRVLLVHDEVLGRELALKELLPESVGGEASGAPTPVRMSVPVVARFLQEARITGQLEHPSIVPVYELGNRKDGTLYYTMKLVRGKTLQQAITEAKDGKERLQLLPHYVDLCYAVAYAHSRGVIHRDIKPGNVMIGEFGETVLLDWGLAKVKGKQDMHAAGLKETIRAMNLGIETEVDKTQYGQILGTPVYMPPEQAKGDLDAIDERSDIYSLGAVLYEILTGKTPFAGQSLARTIYQVLNEDPTPVRKMERGAPAELTDVCQRAMEKEPGKRYQSARQLALRIEIYKPRTFYIDPSRPTVEDLVPELANISKKECRQLVKEALRQCRRRKKLELFGIWLPVVVASFIACSFMGASMPLGTLAKQVVSLNSQLESLTRAFNGVAGQLPNHPQMTGITSFESKDVNKATTILVWMRPFVFLSVVTALCLAYFIVKLSTQATRQLQVPFIREALAEYEVKRGTKGLQDQ